MVSIQSATIEQLANRVKTPPPHPADTMASLEDRIRSMRQEAIGPTWVEALARRQLRYMSSNSPNGFRWGSDVHCHGAGVSMGGSGVIKAYFLDTDTGATTPQAHFNQTGEWPEAVAQREGGNNTVTLTVTSENTTHRLGMGRARGWNGWSDTSDLIVGTLASFEHNFEALLLGYASRPSLPVSSEWQLPNLVLSQTIRQRENYWNATIDVPEQFAPSASYSYTLAAPSPVMSVQFEVEAPEDSRGYVQLWNSNKEQVTVTDELKFSKGTTRTAVTVTGNPFTLQSGFVNINPSHAPSGITVKSVTTTPPAI